LYVACPRDTAHSHDQLIPTNQMREKWTWKNSRSGIRRGRRRGTLLGLVEAGSVLLEAHVMALPVAMVMAMAAAAAAAMAMWSSLIDPSGPTPDD
jgi:hypothetical protein